MNVGVDDADVFGIGKDPMQQGFALEHLLRMAGEQREQVVDDEYGEQEDPDPVGYPAAEQRQQAECERRVGGLDVRSNGENRFFEDFEKSSKRYCPSTC